MVDENGSKRSGSLHGTDSVRRDAGLRENDSSQSRLLPGSLSLVGVGLSGGRKNTAPGRGTMPLTRNPKVTNGGEGKTHQPGEPDQGGVKKEHGERKPPEGGRDRNFSEP